MDHTYIKFYENEYRVLQILIRDMDENDFNPDTATCSVEDDLGNIVMEETTCMVADNTARVVIPTTITDTHGRYKVIWTIRKDGYVYKHKTILNIEELS